MDGYLGQKNDQIDREIFAFLQGLIVKSKESEEIVEMLKKQEKDKCGEYTLPWCPEDYYTYAGEIPWCDTYPASRLGGVETFETESRYSVP